MASRALLRQLTPLTPLWRQPVSSRANFTRFVGTTVGSRARPTTAARRASTARLTEAEIESEVRGSTPSESVPSSSTLQSTAADSTATNGGSSPFPEAESGLAAAAGDGVTDWSKSYHGLSQSPFPKESADVLLAPIDERDIEIKPGPFAVLSFFRRPTDYDGRAVIDGLIYLPEIKYRRVLNRAFGPGGWGLAPRSETNVGPKIVSREYALVCLGRLVGIARGEQEYFEVHGIPTATEACKSNALMRCCKDLGVASELWDPRFIREFKAKHCVEVFAEHLPSKKKYVRGLFAVSCYIPDAFSVTGRSYGGARTNPNSSTHGKSNGVVAVIPHIMHEFLHGGSQYITLQCYSLPHKRITNHHSPHVFHKSNSDRSSTEISHILTHSLLLSTLLFLGWARLCRAFQRGWRNRTSDLSRLLTSSPRNLLTFLLGDGSAAHAFLCFVLLLLVTSVEELNEERASETRKSHECEARDLHRDVVQGKRKAGKVVHEPFAAKHIT